MTGYVNGPNLRYSSGTGVPRVADHGGTVGGEADRQTVDRKQSSVKSNILISNDRSTDPMNSGGRFRVGPGRGHSHTSLYSEGARASNLSSIGRILMSIAPCSSLYVKSIPSQFNICQLSVSFGVVNRNK